jgi:hypothetical protein
MKNKFLIAYSNNMFESKEVIGDEEIRLLNKGVINYIYDVESNQINGLTNEGIKKIDIEHISPDKPKTNTETKK